MHQAAEQPSTRPLLDMIDNQDVKPIVEVEYAREDNTLDRWAKFHLANPHVYRLIVKMAREMRQRGIQHYGIAAIFEVIRYVGVTTHGDRYKLNNSHRAYYARLVMNLEPDLAGFFETRSTPHDAEFHARKEHHEQVCRRT